MKEMQDYLGDAVYVKFDPVSVIFELRANDPNTGDVVYLEPEVLAALNRFAKRVEDAIKAENAKQIKKM